MTTHVQQLPQPEGRPESLSDRVLDRLRADIIEGRLDEARVFSEAETAAWYGVSKAPVREALALLRRLGWIEVLPRAGYRMVPLTLRSAIDLSTVRTALEPTVVGLAARNARRFPVEISALLEYRSDAAEPASACEIAHHRFHRRVLLLAGNAELERILSETYLKLRRFATLEAAYNHPPEYSWDHRPIAEAIAAGDIQAASAAAEAHVKQAADSLRDALIASDTLLLAALRAPSADGLGTGTPGSQQGLPA